MSKSLRGLLNLGIVLAVAALFCGFLPYLQTTLLGIPKAFLPVIQLPPEKLTAEPLFFIGSSPVYLTNTIVAVLLADLILIVLALLACARLREVPEGLYGVFEMLIEGLYNLTEQLVGNRRARPIFMIITTIFLLILTANWMHFIPGVDSVGILHHAEEGHEGYAATPIGGSNIFYLDEPAEGEHGEYVVTPFLRTASTDINLPLGLAIVSFVTIQVFGVIALGGGYLAKFINLPALGKGGMGFIDFGVGLLELILEPVKIVSLTFRLLGNIFGGAILLFVISTLVPFLLPTALYGFEMFIGVIQAFVFAMLTLMFTSLAMTSHHAEEHAEGHH